MNIQSFYRLISKPKPLSEAAPSSSLDKQLKTIDTA